MQAGIFSTHALWPSHFETDLEIAQMEIEAGSQVTIFNCSSSISHCEMLWNEQVKTGDLSATGEVSKSGSSCLDCMSKQKRGFSLLKGEFEIKDLIVESIGDSVFSGHEKYFQTASSLKQLKIDDYEVGWGLFSSLVSCYRDPFVDIEKHKDELNNLYQDCARIYHSTIENIKKHNLTRVYVFNGRYAYTKAILEACIKLKVECLVHERGASFKKYSLFKNHTIHNITMLSREIRKHWDKEKNHELKKELGSQYYLDRKNNIIGSWSSFLDEQDENSLPHDWEESNFNVVLFTSTEDEYMSISPDWDNPYYTNQIEGISHVSNILAEVEGIHLYIRVHPNSRVLTDDYNRSILQLNSIKNVTVIPYDSAISSYSLLDKCDKVVTFGSTVGMEAVFWGKPSVLLARCLYSEFSGPICPVDRDEIPSLILNKNAKNIESNDVLKYGYYFKTFGKDYKFYDALDYKSGKFKGVDLNVVLRKEWQKPSLALRIRNKINGWLQ